jgi:GT2 family glycosyltransferase
MNISIIIATFNRTELLKACLDEIHRQLPGAQILVGINGTDPKTQSYLQTQNQVTFSVFQKKSPGEIRNELTKLVANPWICFLDDDVIIGKDYFKKCFELIENNTDIDILGGPDTSYPNESKMETAISLALTSPLATANSRRRHTKSSKSYYSTNEQDFILCNLWMKSEIFLKEGFTFDKRFFRNEENVLLNELFSNNKKSLYSGEIYVHHKRKSNLKVMSVTVMKSANFRMKSFLLFPSTFNFLYLFPSLFIIYLISLNFCFSMTYSLPVVIYLILLIFFSFQIAKKHKRYDLVAHIVLIQFLINLSYGIGFLSPPRKS